MTPPPPPPPPVPIEKTEEKKTVNTLNGSATTKLVWTFEIEDTKKVPNGYKVINEKAIRAAVKAGVREIPGVRIYQDNELSIKV